MKRVSIGTDGELEVSGLAHGTDHFGSRVDYATSAAILDRYVEAGGNFLDTSNFYAAWIEGGKGGESEALIGKWMKENLGEGIEREEEDFAAEVAALLGN